MSKAIKKTMVSEWTESFRGVSDCVVLGYQGIPAEQVRSLRSRLRKDRGSMKVIRNALAKKAFAEAGLSCLDDLIQGPTAIAYGEDGVAVAKALTEWMKEAGDETAKKLKLRGGALARKRITQADVAELAGLPDKKTMQAMVLATVMAPATQIAGLLQATLAQAAYLVNAHIEKKEKEGPAAEAAPVQ